MRRPILTVLLIVLIGYRNAVGNDSTLAPIATDRPAVTDSSVAVPLGSVQAENGLAETASQGQRIFDASETWLRFGVASKTELRLIVPDYFCNVGLSSGFGDLAIGAKQQIGPIHGFDVSLILSLSLPTGAKAITSHGYDPFVQLPWSRALSRNWTAAGMLSVYWPTEEGARRRPEKPRSSSTAT
jgi:hypothetical protein